MKIFKKVMKQFAKPSGFLGIIAGNIMAKRGSNIERSEWGISLLNIQPSDNVLEIGFGPGIALSKINKFVLEGKVYGIDHSELMVNKATKLNHNSIKNGNMKLFNKSIDELPNFDEKIDKVLDVNSFQFWREPVTALKNIKNKMNDKGVIAIVHQPRKPGATDKDAEKAGEKFKAFVQEAGFANVKVEWKKMEPVSVICVIGNKN